MGHGGRGGGGVGVHGVSNVPYGPVGNGTTSGTDPLNQAASCAIELFK